MNKFLTSLLESTTVFEIVNEVLIGRSQKNVPYTDINCIIYYYFNLF